MWLFVGFGVGRRRSASVRRWPDERRGCDELDGVVMTADELAAGLRSEVHDYSHARMRDQLRRDIERSLSDVDRQRLVDRERESAAFARMMRDTGHR